MVIAFWSELQLQSLGEDSKQSILDSKTHEPTGKS